MRPLAYVFSAFLGASGFALRIVARLLFIVGGMLLLAGAALVGGYLWLRTDEGQLWAGRKAGEALSKTLQGRYVAERVRFGFVDGLLVSGVDVRSDSGQPVLAWKRLRIDWSWAPLLSRRLRVDEILLESPEIHAQQENGVLDIARAFTPRDSGPPEPEEPDAGTFELPMDVEIASLAIVDLRADARLENTDSRLRRFTLDPLSFRAHATLDRELLLTHGFTVATSKSGKVASNGSVTFAPGFAGVLGARGDLLVDGLAPVSLAGARAFDAYAARLNVDATYAWSARERLPDVTVRRFVVDAAAGRIEGRARVDPHENFDIRLASPRLRLSAFPWPLVRPGLAVQGDVRLDIVGNGTPANPNLTVNARACDVVVRDRALPPALAGRSSCLDFAAHLTRSSASADVQGNALGVPLHARGAVKGHLLDRAVDPLRLPLNATVEIGRLPVAILGELAGFEPLGNAEGTLEAGARITGSAGSPNLLFNVNARRVTYDRWNNFTANLSGEVLPMGTHAELTLAQGSTRVGSVAVRVVPPAGPRPDSPVQGVPLSQADALASSVEVDVDLAGMPLPHVDGRAIEGFLQARYEGGGVSTTSSVSLLDARGSSIGVANFSGAADVRPWLADRSAWKAILASANLEADMPDLGALLPFFTQLESLDGSALVRAALQGPLAKPFLGARATLVDVDIVPRSGASFEGVTLDVVATEERVELRRATLNRGGIVTASGSVEGLFPFEPRFRFQASTDDLRVLPLQAFSPTIDADIALEGELKGGVLNATAHVDRFRAFVPDLQGSKGRAAQSLANHPDVAVARDGVALERPDREARSSAAQKTAARTVASDSAEASEPFLREAHLNLQVPGRAWVQGPDIQLELGSNLRADYVDGRVTLDGDAGIVRPGFVQILGKRFEVSQARVGYAVEEPERGSLAVEATHVTDEATVFIEVGGRAAAPAVALRSEPDLAQTEIAALLVTGKTTESLAQERESGESDAEESTQSRVAQVAANVVANHIANQVLGAFAKNTDLVLSIDVENATQRQATVGVGRYLTDRLFVSFDRAFGGEEEGGNGNQVRFDYRLTRRWSLEGNYGDGREGGVDLLWKRKF
jgi:autotransporter translocation and assembly factor TamB